MVTPNGFITLHRKLRDNPIYKNSQLLHLFIELLLMANHEQTRFLWNGQEMILERGQLITGRFALAEATGIKPGTIHSYIASLTAMGIINTKPSNKFTLITIVKYDDYQLNKVKPSTKSNNKPATNQQPASTYNNVNNDNKILTNVSIPTPSDQAKEFFNNTIKQQEVQAWLISKGVPDAVAKSEMEKFIGYWTELDKTGRRQRWQDQKYFDLKRRFVTWFGKAVQFNKSAGGKKRKIWRQPQNLDGPLSVSS